VSPHRKPSAEEGRKNDGIYGASFAEWSKAILSQLRFGQLAWAILALTLIFDPLSESPVLLDFFTL
jgi:hypothetical protein